MLLAFKGARGLTGFLRADRASLGASPSTGSADFGEPVLFHIRGVKYYGAGITVAILYRRHLNGETMAMVLLELSLEFATISVTV